MDRAQAALGDELAIQALVSRYCHAIAVRDDAAWDDTWASDAEWSILGETVRGREAIAAWYRRLVEPLRLVMQVASNGLVEVAGDAATGRWLVTETFQTADGSSNVSLGVYHDRYRRCADGAWRFARREFRPGYLGPPDLSAAATRPGR